MRWEDGVGKSMLYYRSRPHQQAQLEAALEQMGDTAGKLVLDVGCGYGDLIDLLPEGTRYSGIDPDQDVIAEAVRLHPRAKLRCTERLIRADVVVAVASLQCVDDPMAFAWKLWNVTRERLVIVSCVMERMPPAVRVPWWIMLPDVDLVHYEGADYFTAVCNR